MPNPMTTIEQTAMVYEMSEILLDTMALVLLKMGYKPLEADDKQREVFHTVAAMAFTKSLAEVAVIGTKDNDEARMRLECFFKAFSEDEILNALRKHQQEMREYHNRIRLVTQGPKDKSGNDVKQ